MPVIDHEVHEATRQAGDSNPGCYNRKEFAAGYFAPDRVYSPDGTWQSVLTFIPHTMSTECRFDQAISPERCAGCNHRGSGERYSEEIRRYGG